MVRVLVVEDEEKMARAFARVLREEGYAAETVGDGRTGLARALDASFDLLIVDWMLPGRSGVQIVRGLRAADIHTPVLMLTAPRSRTASRASTPGPTTTYPSPSPFRSFWRA